MHPWAVHAPHGRVQIETGQLQDSGRPQREATAGASGPHTAGRTVAAAPRARRHHSHPPCAPCLHSMPHAVLHTPVTVHAPVPILHPSSMHAGTVANIHTSCNGTPNLTKSLKAYGASLATIRLVWYETGVEKEAEAASISA